MTAFRNLHCPQTKPGNHYCPSFEKLVLDIECFYQNSVLFVWIFLQDAQESLFGWLVLMELPTF